MSSTSISAAHTRGPWQALAEECDKPYIRVRGTALGGRYKIANVITPVYDGIHSREAEETRANARLIAAAPELLAALRKCVAQLEMTTGMVNDERCALIDARAAIAKATQC